MAEEKVTWFEEKYDELIKKLDNENSFQRSIGIMLLCDLAKSDSSNKIEKDLSKIINHIEDEKFITSRQCIQNIWKIAISNKSTKEKIEKALMAYFENCENTPHANLLRQDIVSSLWEIKKVNTDQKLEKSIIELVKSEKDAKTKKKLELIIM
jgi:hypothetical protein